MEIDDQLFEELTVIFVETLGVEAVALGLADILASEMLASINGATRAEILAAASETSNLLVANLTQTQMQVLADTLERGLRDQVGIPGLRNEIAKVIDLTPRQAESLAKERARLIAAGESPESIDAALDKLREGMIKDRAEVIAQAEARNAMEAGEIKVALNRGANYKMWITVGDDRVTDGCETNEAQGAIPIDQEFQSGDQHPPRSGNPRCRCTLGYVKDTGRGELGRAQEEATAAAQQTAEAKAKAKTK